MTYNHELKKYNEAYRAYDNARLVYRHAFRDAILSLLIPIVAVPMLSADLLTRSTMPLYQHTGYTVAIISFFVFSGAIIFQVYRLRKKAKALYHKAVALKLMGEG